MASSLDSFDPLQRAPRTRPTAASRPRAANPPHRVAAARDEYEEEVQHLEDDGEDCYEQPSRGSQRSTIDMKSVERALPAARARPSARPAPVAPRQRDESTSDEMPTPTHEDQYDDDEPPMTVSGRTSAQRRAPAASAQPQRRTASARPAAASPSPAPPRARRAPPHVRPVDEDFDDVDEDFEPAPQPRVAQPKRVTQAQPARQSRPPPQPVDDLDEDFDEQPPPTRRAQPRAPAPKSAAPKTRVVRRTVVEEDVEEDVVEEEEPRSVRGVQRTAPRARRSRVAINEDEEDFDGEDEAGGDDDAEFGDARGRRLDGSVKDSRNWQIKLAHTKSSMGLNKNCVQWSFEHNGALHTVELFHSTFGGKRTIKVDGIVKVSEKKLVDNGSKYHLDIKDGILIAVELKPVGVSGNVYELYIDNRDYDHAKRFWMKHDDGASTSPVGSKPKGARKQR